MCTTSDVAIFAFDGAFEDPLELLAAQALGSNYQKISRKRRASKPAKGDIDVSLRHQRAVVDDVSQSLRKHQPGCTSGPLFLATLC